MEYTGLLFLFTCQPAISSNFSCSGVNVGVHLLRKNYSGNFSSIQSAPIFTKVLVNDIFGDTHNALAYMSIKLIADNRVLIRFFTKSF